ARTPEIQSRRRGGADEPGGPNPRRDPGEGPRARTRGLGTSREGVCTRHRPTYRVGMTDSNSGSDISSGKRGGSDAAGGTDKPDFASRDMEQSEAPIDQLGDQPKADSEQNPPLPDTGPTDGEHGTDQDPA